MKILLVGASGVIGSAIKQKLETEHQVFTANCQSEADVQLDLSNPDSIIKAFEKVGMVDAIISAAGFGQMLPLSQHTQALYLKTFENKVMGQVNLLRYGLEYINKGGSVTLTSGLASRFPMPGTSSISMTTAALEAFVKAASLELDDVRLNVVSPFMVKESAEKFGFDVPNAISANATADVYLQALTGDFHGQVMDTPDFAHRGVA